MSLPTPQWFVREIMPLMLIYICRNISAERYIMNSNYCLTCCYVELNKNYALTIYNICGIYYLSL